MIKELTSEEIKKILEKQICEDFLKSHSGLIKFEQSEGPDSIFTNSKGKKFGVEVTGYYDDFKSRYSNEENWGRLQKKLIKKRKALDLSTLSRKIHGRLYFRENLPGKTQDEKFIEQLMAFTELKAPDLILNETKIFSPGSAYHLLSKYLERIKLKMTSMDWFRWEAPSISGGSVNFNRQVLEARIREKNVKCENYYKGKKGTNFKEIWLMIVCNNVQSSVWSRIPDWEDLKSEFNEQHPEIARSSFDQIHLFSRLDMRSIRLK